MAPLTQFLDRAGAMPRGLLGQLYCLFIGWVNNHLNEAALDRLVPFPGERILEIGCGVGNALGRLAAIAGMGRISGVDHAPLMIRQAQAWNRDAILAGLVTLHQAAVSALPLQDRSVDAALAVDNFQYWPDPVGDLAEIRRVLRPGGRLVIALRGACFNSSIERSKQAEDALALAGFVELTVERVALRPWSGTILIARRPHS